MALGQFVGLRPLLIAVALTAPVSVWTIVTQGWLWGLAALVVSNILIQSGFLYGSFLAMRRDEARSRRENSGLADGSERLQSR